MVFTKYKIYEDIGKARMNKLSKEDCVKDIDFLVSLRCWSDVEGVDASEEEKELTDYFIKKFIVEKEGA